MKVHHLEEYSIPPKMVADINGLLKSCFDGYPSDRNYYKSLPTFRLLVWDKKMLVGHLSVVFRIVKIGSTIARIFGISDVCVHPAHRSKKIASLLLDHLDKTSRMYQVHFLVLIASDHSLYSKHGFQSVSNNVRWLLINDQQSLGVMNGHLDKSLMVKATGELEWNEGLLDLMGGVF
jgi:predicted N-acetyltransferase YhbS